jgi:purine-nucleoside/S-methyl-5'-thioadenosine phosphorylase / adenosine deaminase
MTADKRPYLTVPKLDPVSGLVHGFGDARWSEADFLAFAAARGMRPVIMRQLHSDVLHRLDAPPAGKLEGDALMTSVPGLLLVIRTADCLPILLVDETNRAVAAVHCGWRGTEKRILEKAIRAMGEAYGSKPAEMRAALGPCIGAACYEVGPEVREAFLGAGFPPSVFVERGNLPAIQVPELKKKFLLDLRAANRWLLAGLGFRKAHVLDAGPACTHCEPRLLSYRRHPADPRRMYNFIGFEA